MKQTAKYLIAAILTITLTATIEAMGASPKQATVLACDMTIEENLATPEVPTKASSAVIRHMSRIAKVFEKHGLNVRYMRRGEVIVVSVPADMLFMPNETSLSTSAPSVLSAFTSIVRLPDLYKVLLVSHTDDSGSETYADYITEERSNAVDDYFQNELSNQKLNIVPYGMGADEPLNANTSIGGRQANRRVEFYIIPEQQLVEMARANKL